MAAHLIEPAEPIDVKHLGCILYGQPGARKTSLAQTADAPFTFAFDPGIHRVFAPVRKACALFDQWEDVIVACNNADFAREGRSLEFPADLDLDRQRRYALMCQRIHEAKTIVLDTAGAGMEKMADALIRESPKNGNRLGGLSLAGYGVLGNRFGAWVSRLFQGGKDLVMLAHEESEKVGDENYYFPSFVGKKFYNTAMRYGDIVGYMHFQGGKRVVGWEPTDRYMAKTPPCGWQVKPLPDFAAQPECLAVLLAEAKASMGRISQASAAVAKVVEEWQSALSLDPTLDGLNAMLPDMAKLDNGAKRQVWHLIQEFAEQGGLVFDKGTKKFQKGAA